jgi:hypothetical protein
VATEHLDTYYTFKVSLIGERRGWRTIILRGDRTLYSLHKTICHVFDRRESDRYSFYFPSEKAAYKFDPYPKEYVSEVMARKSRPLSDRPPLDAAKTVLDSLHLLINQTFEYLSDFPDSILHEIRVLPKQLLVRRKLQAVEKSDWESPEQYF